MNFETGEITNDALALAQIERGDAVAISPEMARSMAPVAAPKRAEIARELRNLERTQPGMSRQAREALAVKIATHGGR